MKFTEFQDRVLANSTDCYTSNRATILLWVLTTEELLSDCVIETGEDIDIDEITSKLGVALRNLAAIATELGLDLQEVAEKSLKIK